MISFSWILVIPLRWTWSADDYQKTFFLILSTSQLIPLLTFSAVVVKAEDCRSKINVKVLEPNDNSKSNSNQLRTSTFVVNKSLGSINIST